MKFIFQEYDIISPIINTRKYEYDSLSDIKLSICNSRNLTTNWGLWHNIKIQCSMIKEMVIANNWILSQITELFLSSRCIVGVLKH